MDGLDQRKNLSFAVQLEVRCKRPSLPSYRSCSGYILSILTIVLWKPPMCLTQHTLSSRHRSMTLCHVFEAGSVGWWTPANLVMYPTDFWRYSVQLLACDWSVEGWLCLESWSTNTRSCHCQPHPVGAGTVRLRESESDWASWSWFCSSDSQGTSSLHPYIHTHSFTPTKWSGLLKDFLDTRDTSQFGSLSHINPWKNLKDTVRTWTIFNHEKRDWFSLFSMCVPTRDDRFRDWRL